MGNNGSSSSQLSNYSKRNVRVFVTEKATEIDGFLVSREAGDLEKLASAVIPGCKKFCFKDDVKCVRVLASQTQDVPWEADRFVSLFVEDEDDEKICSKQIVHNMQLKAPITVLLFDV